MHSLAESERDKLVGFLVKRGVIRSDAEDIVQQAMFKAWRKRHQYRGDSKWSTWVCSIVRNEYLMSVRRFRPILEPLTVVSEIESPHVNPCDELIREEQKRTLLTNLAALPLEDRQIMRLVYFEDKTIKEAAGSLGLTVPAAKTRCWRAINRLRTRLGGSRCNSSPH